jgi:hypothetical protein
VNASGSNSGCLAHPPRTATAAAVIMAALMLPVYPVKNFLLIMHLFFSGNCSSIFVIEKSVPV